MINGQPELSIGKKKIYDVESEISAFLIFVEIYKMIIVFVIDSYGILTNGTTITAWRFVEALKARGHTVRIVSSGISGENMYPVRVVNIPIVSSIAKKQSVYFSVSDKEVFRRAFAGADVVHFFMPWRSAIVGKKVADEMGIPATAAFHVQPENITYGIGLGIIGTPIASCIYFGFREAFYRRFDNIHCPSSFIAGELRKHGYHAKLHVISNGIGSQFTMIEKKKDDGYFRILMTGRYAPEKRQDVLINAILKSPYERKILLTLAGAGPREKKLKKLAKKLHNEVRFGFQQQSDLIETLHQTDLYVHAADVEIEAISCLEAIACGVVPVISNSKKSATRQFALDDRSLFRAGNSEDLKNKIGYWIEHEDERKNMGNAYHKFSEIYRLDYSIRKAEGMFQEAVRDKRDREFEKTPAGKKYRRRILKSPVGRIFSFLLYYVLAIPLLIIILHLFLGLKIKNRKALLKIPHRRGAVIISNHVHTMDSPMAAVTLIPKKIVFTSIPSNFTRSVSGFLVKYLGTVPIPQSPGESRIFFRELSQEIRNGRFVHFFPEGKLIKYDTALRPLKKGAFHLAVGAQVPVIPIAITFPERKKGFRHLFRKYDIILTVGDPIYPDLRLIKKEAVIDLHDRAEEILSSMIQPASCVADTPHYKVENCDTEL